MNSFLLLCKFMLRPIHLLNTWQTLESFMPFQKVGVIIYFLLLRRIVKHERGVEDIVIPRIEDNICNGQFVANQILLTGEDAVKDGNDANDLNTT